MELVAPSLNVLLTAAEQLASVIDIDVDDAGDAETASERRARLAAARAERAEERERKRARDSMPAAADAPAADDDEAADEESGSDADDWVADEEAHARRARTASARAAREAQRQRRHARNQQRTDAGAAGRDARAVLRDEDMAAAALERDLERLEEALGPTGNGASISAIRKGIALKVVLAAYKRDHLVPDFQLPPTASAAERLRIASRLSGVSVSSIRKYLVQLRKDGTIAEEDTAVRGGGSWLHPLSDYARRAKYREILAGYMTFHVEPETATWATRVGARDAILAETGDHVSLDAVGRMLRRLGYDYGELQEATGRTTSLFRQRLRRVWAMRMMTLKRAGYKFAAVDETWVRTGAAHVYGWGLAGDMGVGWRNGKRSVEGDRRVCIIGAICEDGWVGACSGERPEPGDIETVVPFAEMIFPSFPYSDMYSGNTTQHTVMAFVHNRLIPALKAQYPDPNTKVVVLFDNAPTHVGVGASAGARVWKLKRGELIDYLVSLGCTSLSVENETRGPGGVVQGHVALQVDLTDSQERGRNGKNGVARIDELRAAAELWLYHNKPEELQNEIERAFAAAFGKRVLPLWTPPYYPEGNPIEMAWAVAKRFCALRPDETKSTEGMIATFRAGLYTDEEAIPSARYRGGNFVPDAAGKCDAAARLFEHVFTSPRGGVQLVVEYDKAFDGVDQHDRTRFFVRDPDERDLAIDPLHFNRSATRMLVKLQLAAEDATLRASLHETAMLADVEEEEDFDEE
jgi:transposase